MRVLFHFVLFFLISFLIGCEGQSDQENLTVEGGKRLFEKRRYAKQYTMEEKVERQEKSDSLTKRYLPPRRRTLQIRVPIDEHSLTKLSFQTGQLGLQSLSDSLRILELKQRELLLKQEELLNFEKEVASRFTLEEEAYRFEVEKIILQDMGEIEERLFDFKAQTIIGFNQDLSENNFMVFGRSQLGKRDEYIDLQKNFLFMGHDLLVGVSIGNIQDIRPMIAHRMIRTNFSGLRVYVVLQALADSIDLPIHLSQNIMNMSQEIFMDIKNADVLDILNVIIEEHNITIVYDRQKKIARFYTNDEFKKHLSVAIKIAIDHNKMANIYQEVSRGEKHYQELFEIYNTYFNQVGEEARWRSISSLLTVDTRLSHATSKTLIILKENAFTRQNSLNKLRNLEILTRRKVKNEIFSLKQAVALRKQEYNHLQMVQADKKNGSGANVLKAMKKDIDQYMPDIVKDISLATSEPIYTDRFTVFHQETEMVASSLETYFEKIYPNKTMTFEVDKTGGDKQDVNVPETTQVVGNSEIVKMQDNNFRPPRINVDKTALVITGLKADIDLAHKLIKDLDIPAKQVLVEVFMVNVARNWQRKLEASIQIAENISKFSPDLNFIGSLISNNVKNQFSISNTSGSLTGLIDYMEVKDIGRTVSSPTILAKDRVPASIKRTVTRFREVTTQNPTGETNGTTGAPVFKTISSYVPVEASLNLSVTPTINVLNDHVSLEINFEDSTFLGEEANSPQLSNNIITSMDAAPGDVIVLAGLYREANKKINKPLPILGSLPIIGDFFVSAQDKQIQSDELIIFLAPTVITPRIGISPENMMR